MPTYDFVCDKCRKQVEVTQSYNDAYPVCHNQPMRKLPSAFQIRTPFHLQPENDLGRRKQQAYMERPEVKAKMKSGTLDTEVGIG